MRLISAKATFSDVVSAMLRLNQDSRVTRERLMVNPGVDGPVQVDAEDPSHVLSSIDWAGLGITSLPGILGHLWIDKDLSLKDNNIAELPSGFCRLVVERNLRLGGNALVSLPHTFRELKVGGHLMLNDNCISALPQEDPTFRTRTLTLTLMLTLTRTPTLTLTLTLTPTLTLS